MHEVYVWKEISINLNAFPQSDLKEKVFTLFDSIQIKSLEEESLKLKKDFLLNFILDSHVWWL